MPKDLHTPLYHKLHVCDRTDSERPEISCATSGSTINDTAKNIVQEVNQSIWIALDGLGYLQQLIPQNKKVAKPGSSVSAVMKVPMRNSASAIAPVNMASISSNECFTGNHTSYSLV